MKAKHVWGLLLCLALMLMMLPVSTQATGTELVVTHLAEGGLGDEITAALGSTAVEDYTKLKVIIGNAALNGYYFRDDWGAICKLDQQLPNLSALELVYTGSDQIIPEQAMLDCKWLETLTLTTAGGALTDIRKQAFGGTNLSGMLTIPASVRTIGLQAFSNLSNLTGLSLPANGNLDNIGPDAFSYTGLTGVLTIPASVTRIENQAFRNSPGITGLLLAENGNLDYIGNLAFFATGIAGTLTIPASVTSIERGAFQGLSLLTSLILPGTGNLAIGEEAFKGTGLTGTLIIPSPVASIGRNTFTVCTQLDALLFKNTESAPNMPLSIANPPIPAYYPETANASYFAQGTYSPSWIPYGNATARLTHFRLNGARGTIDEEKKTVTVNLPSGTDLSSLAPDIGFIGASIDPATGTAQDFSSLSHTFTVTAVAGGSAAYTVNIFSPSPAITGNNVLLGSMGGMKDLPVNATVSEIFPNCKIDLIAKIGSFTATANRTGNGDITFNFAATDLNSLNLGSYDIEVSSEATAFHAAIPSTKVGTLTVELDDTPPTVSSVSPTGTVPASTNSLSISFSEAMNTDISALGTVTLSNGATLSSPLWDNDTTITYTLPGLATGAEYTVIISGFKDLVGNLMTVPSTSPTFTTKASTDALLSALAISEGTLDPLFTRNTYAYTAAVENSTSSLTLTPTANDIYATIKVNDTPLTSGIASEEIPLLVGENTITIVVTAQDSVTTQAYTIVVTRAPSRDARLFALTISEGTLLPVFASDANAYTASVANNISSINLTPTVNETNATITVNGTDVLSGVPSEDIPLLVGENTITIVVTAQSGDTKTYTLTVTRAPSTDSLLSALTISEGTILPVFASDTTSYTASVENNVSSLNIIPAANDANATITVNGTDVISGVPSEDIPLLVGENTITIVVTAQSGDTKTYTLTVTRAPSTDSLLSALTISEGTILPVFVSETNAYTAAVESSVSSLNITPTANDANATVTVNGTAVISGMPSEDIPLTVGENTITIVVSAQDNVTTQTYTVTITRESPYIPRTLIDSTTGIIVSGNIHQDSALTVSDLGQDSSAACPAFLQRMNDDDYVLLLGKDISLPHGFTGELTVALPVSSEYNGETVTILHCVDGTLRTYTATVEDGKVTFTVTSLSPFAVFAKADKPEDSVPKTGESGSSPLGFVLLALSMFIGSLLLWQRRQKRMI